MHRGMIKNCKYGDTGFSPFELCPIGDVLILFVNVITDLSWLKMNHNYDTVTLLNTRRT